MRQECCIYPTLFKIYIEWRQTGRKMGLLLADYQVMLTEDEGDKLVAEYGKWNFELNNEETKDMEGI